MTARDQKPDFLDVLGNPFDRLPDSIRPGVGAVIFNENREVLLEKRADYGVWGLPGGGVSIGESVEEGVVREVLEETGLRVVVKRLVGIYSDPRRYAIARYPDGDTVQWVSLVFECERQAGDLRISEESTDVAYFDTGALPDNAVLGHVARIQDALANRVAPFIR